MEQVEVMKGKHRGELFGPLPGVRIGDVIAYEVELPERFVPWPGRTRLERVFVLLDLGVSFSNPPWRHSEHPEDAHIWYVDLISINRAGDRYEFRDLYVDVIVPTDGRSYRQLDLDELADASAEGLLTSDEVVDALRRWQRFLDRHLHTEVSPPRTWSDFPPAAIRPLQDLAAPLGPPVRWTD